VAVYFTGTAGAGKTTLVRAFRNWMEEAGYDSVTLNLDPGMEDPAFDPDVDIRDWVKLPEVMAEHNLGPNGAQVAASDLIALKVYEVRQVLEGYRADYLLVDTPGQVELFAFRESSRAIVDALNGDRSLLLFLFDPALARTPSGYVSLMLLSATVQFRFQVPLLSAIAKGDLLTPGERETLLRWGESPPSLLEDLGSAGLDTSGILSTELFRVLETLQPLWPRVVTSGEGREGLEDIYDAVQRTFAGGEDLETRGGGPSEEGGP